MLGMVGGFLLLSSIVGSGIDVLIGVVVVVSVLAGLPQPIITNAMLTIR